MVNKKSKTAQNQKGQTLIIIFFVMILALSVGVSVSNRYITSLRSSTRTYTRFRSTAVAESGLERILTKSKQELDDYITYGTCGSNCQLQIVNDDGLTETATLTLSYLGNSSDIFNVLLKTDDVREINLKGYPDNTDLTVCWDDPTSGAIASVVGMLVYENGGYKADAFAYNSSTSSYTNGFSNTTGAEGYQSCFTINTKSSPQILRLRSIYNSVDVAVIPAGTAQIPSQGILIESLGEVLDTKEKVSVVKGDNILPMQFDFTLYSKSTTDPLSN